MGAIGKKLASRFRKAKKQLDDLRRQMAADFGKVPKDAKTVQAMIRLSLGAQNPPALGA